MPQPWLTGHFIQPQYLNSLQELLSDYSDNVLLEYSGADLLVPANASAPAQLIVDGYMKTNLATSLLTLSGASQTFHVYATANRAVASWGLGASPTQVVAAHTRKIGEADFDGVQITEVRSAVREMNVSHLLGHQAVEVAAPQQIPAGTASGTLDPNWVDNIDANLMPVGGVREVWVPSGMAVQVPTGWRIMDGSIVGVASHSFPGVGIFALPDMRNKMSLGANSGAGYGTPGSSGGVAPGMGAVGGTNQGVIFPHGHGPIPDHSHTVDPHTHDMEHLHWFEAHRHGYTGQSASYTGNAVSNFLIDRDPVAGFVTDYDVRRAYSGGVGGPTAGPTLPGDPFPGSNANIVSFGVFGSNNTGSAGMNTSAINPPGGGTTTPDSAGTVDPRPHTLGLVYMMRVM